MGHGITYIVDHLVTKIFMPQEKVGKPLLLIFPFGYLSHYLRCLVLARHLRASFEVMFASDPSYDPYLSAEGFKTFACKAMDAAETLKCIEKFDFSWLNEQNLESVFLDQVRVLETLHPAAVLGDATPTLKMAAAKVGVKFISLINGYMSKYFAGSRALSVTHPAYALVKKLPEKIAVMVTGQGEALGFKVVHKPFKKLRRKWGLPEAKYYLDEMEGDLNLIPDLLSLFPQKKLPASYKIISPLFFTGMASLPRCSLAEGRKKIFVSMGSTGAWNSVAFLNHPDFAAYQIIAAGDHEHVLSAAHITPVPFADAATLFPEIDLVICHGGNGSIYQALAFGIPVLCKAAHFEQEWNVAAVVREKVGESLAGIEDHEVTKGMITWWIRQKGTAVFEQYARKIALYQADLPKAMNDVANGILGPLMEAQEV